MPKKYRIIVNREVCIACGMAPATCPEVFHLAEDNGKNSVVPKYEIEHTDSKSVGVIPEELYGCAKAGADVCPVGAIKIEPIEE